MTKPTMKPLELERFNSEEILLFNTIFTRNLSLPVKIGKGEYILRFTASKPELNDQMVIKMSLGKNSFYTFVEKPFFNRHITQFMDDEISSTIPSWLKETIAEALLEDTLDELDMAFGCNSKIEGIYDETDDKIEESLWLPFYLADANEHAITSGIFAMDKGVISQLLDRLSELSPVETLEWKDLTFQTHFLIGKTRISLMDFQRLSPGDIVILDEKPSGKESEIWIYFPPSTYLTGTREEDKLIVNGGKGITMTEENNEEIEHQEPVLSNVDELDVNLTFEVGRKTVTLNDLKTIEPGYVFDLKNTLQNAVTIRANGKVAGKGQLVQIEDRVGVKITEIFENASGEST